MFEDGSKSLPVGYELVKKTIHYQDKKTGKQKEKHKKQKMKNSENLYLKHRKTTFLSNMY